MRLDFNIVVVDDDADDPDSCGALLEFIEKLKIKISDKGFKPVTNIFPSVVKANEEFPPNASIRRVDLYLSDNNLGDNPLHTNLDAKNGGIEYYLEIKNRYICDFVLYTRSAVDEIVQHLSDDLLKRKDPNLFSRFTFVSRSESGEGWYAPIFSVVDHILSKREEINNLRGLYAQKTAEMHNHLRKKLGKGADKKTFSEVIDLASKMPKSGGGFLIDSTLKNYLERQRDIRNGVIHNDEVFDEALKCWYVKYDWNGTTQRINEADFKKERAHLMSTVERVLAL